MRVVWQYLGRRKVPAWSIRRVRYAPPKGVPKRAESTDNDGIINLTAAVTRVANAIECAISMAGDRVAPSVADMWRDDVRALRTLIKEGGDE